MNQIINLLTPPYRSDVLLKRLKQRATEMEEALMQETKESMNLKESEEGRLRLLNYYTGTALFPNGNIKSKFAELGFNTAWQLWLIPFSKIETQLKRMADAGIKVTRNWYVLSAVYLHLVSKIFSTIEEWGDSQYVKRKSENNLDSNDAKDLLRTEGRMRSLVRRRKDGKGSPRSFIDKADFSLNELLDEANKIVPGDEKIEVKLIEFLTGNTNREIIKPLIRDFMCPPKMSKADFCIYLYDFLTIIALDDTDVYKTDIEFIKYAAVSYGSSFRKYKVELITKRYLRT